MDYHKAMAQYPKWRCPFCNLKAGEIIQTYKHFYVIPTRAPYCEDHLLIVPQKHICLLKDMKSEQHIELYQIVDEWAAKLHKQYADVDLLLKDGLVGGHSWKSQNHLHFHLIPDYELWWQNKSEDIKREFLEEDKYQKIVKRIQSQYIK